MSMITEPSRTAVINRGNNPTIHNEIQNIEFNRWSILGGGALGGTISALVLGIIFGPLAALIGFILSGLGSTIHAFLVAKRCEKEVCAVSDTSLANPKLEKAEQLDDPAMKSEAGNTTTYKEILENQKKTRAILKQLEK